MHPLTDLDGGNINIIIAEDRIQNTEYRLGVSTTDEQPRDGLQYIIAEGFLT